MESNHSDSCNKDMQVTREKSNLYIDKYINRKDSKQGRLKYQIGIAQCPIIST